MGEPLKHIPVKLIIGLISSKPAQFNFVKDVIERKFGKIDKESDILDFSCTRYYNKEFGENLKRKFFSFKNLVFLHKSYRIKLYTNAIEKKNLKKPGRNRAVNIDPGYVSLTQVVLFTTKGRSHRIYIDKGIYADLELCFINKSFRPLAWTYSDYRTDKYINFFNSVRTEYVSQVRGYL